MKKEKEEVSAQPSDNKKQFTYSVARSQQAVCNTLNFCFNLQIRTEENITITKETQIFINIKIQIWWRINKWLIYKPASSPPLTSK